MDAARLRSCKSLIDIPERGDLPAWRRATRPVFLRALPTLIRREERAKAKIAIPRAAD